MRGAKKDITVTRNLREAGFFENKDSFVSLTGHLFLEGLDKSRVRAKVFRKHKNRCVVCRAKLDPKAPDFHPMRGAWHHPNSAFHCDCVSCSELRCDTTTGRKCHAHGTVGFQRKAEAVKAFQQLYP